MSENKTVIWPQEIIKRDAQAIEQAAQLTVRKIITRRQAIDAHTDKPNQHPLFVMAGEVHSNPVHRLFHLRVLKDLKASGYKTLAGIEGPCDAVEKGFSLTFDKEIDSDAAAKIRQYDTDGTLSLITELAFMHEKYGRYSGRALKSFILANLDAQALAARYVDAKTDIGHLDITDAFTKAAFGKMPLMPNVNFASPLGMKIRNKHMAGMLIDAAAQTESDIVYHKTGISHVCGTKRYAQKDSLSAYFTRHAQEVMAIPLVSIRKALSDLPRRIKLGAHELLTITTLPDYVAYDGDDAEMLDDYHIDMKTMAEEASYVDAILQEWGMADHVINLETWEQTQDQYFDELAPLYKRWARDFFDIKLG